MPSVLPLCGSSYNTCSLLNQLSIHKIRRFTQPPGFRRTNTGYIAVNPLTLCLVLCVFQLVPKNVQAVTNFNPPGTFGGRAFHFFICHDFRPLFHASSFRAFSRTISRCFDKLIIRHTFLSPVGTGYKRRTCAACLSGSINNGFFDPFDFVSVAFYDVNIYNLFPGGELFGLFLCLKTPGKNPPPCMSVLPIKPGCRFIHNQGRLSINRRFLLFRLSQNVRRKR